MKYLLLCVIIVIISCKSKKSVPICQDCGIDQIGNISIDLRDTTFAEFAKKILNSTNADTVYFFTGYTNEKTICQTLGCYQIDFNKIQFDDRCGLLLLKYPSQMKYRLICDSNLMHTRNFIYPQRQFR